KVQKDGTIQPSRLVKSSKRGWDDGEEEPALRLPLDSREFFEPFQRTLEQCLAFASDCVRQSVHEQLAGLTKRAQPYGEQAGPIPATLRSSSPGSARRTSPAATTRSSFCGCETLWPTPCAGASCSRLAS